jgi:hypothetical protein
MSGKYPLSFHRRIERQWAERIKSLSRIHGQIAVAAVQMLQHVFSHNGSLILIPVRTVVRGRRLDRLVHITQRGVPCDFGDMIAL